MKTLARIGAIQPEQKTVEGVTMLDLASYVRTCWQAAKDHKQKINERLLKCDRQRKGIYDPDIAMEVAKAGNTNVYMMLTDIKCRAAESWINDVMMSAEKVFSIRPTTEPDLPDELKVEIVQTVFTEAQQVSQTQQVMPEAVQMRMQELYEQVKQEIHAAAETRAGRMEDRIQDHLDESGFTEVQQDWINDFCTYPTAFLAGPLVHKRKVQKWGPEWTPVVETKEVLDFERVSPYDMFPGPGATSINDTYLIRRHKLARKELQACIGQPGYNDDQIKQALDLYGRNGLKDWESVDSEKDWIDDKNMSFTTINTITALEFWGPVSGAMLKQWGMKGVDSYTDYEANVWLVGPFCIRAVINSHPLGYRPFSAASFRRVPGSIWGLGLPESMRDVQIMCNAAARAMAGNMSIASGPQVEVTMDRLPPGADLEEMYPWKIWQTTSDRTGGGQPAIRFFQPNMNAEALLGIYQYFQKVADEVTGVPNYIYGSTAVSGAGRTASGLSMLMENAAKGIKNAILRLDNAQSEAIQRTFDYLMKYDPDPMIKGDMRIVPVGIVATLIKEGVQERRQAFLTATANPFDAPIIGPDRRAAQLRTFSKDLEMDPDDVAPDPKEIRRQMLVNQQMQAVAMSNEDQMANQQQGPQRITFQRGPDGEVTGAMVDGGMVDDRTVSQQQASVTDQLAALENQLAQIEQGLQ